MSEAQKIAFYIEDGRFSGPHKYIFEVSNELHKRGYDVLVIVSKYESEYFIKKLQQNNIPYVILPLSRLTKQMKLLARYIILFPFEVVMVRSIVKKHGIDIFNVAGGAWQFKGVLSVIFSRAKIVWRLNDTSMSDLFKYIFRVLCKYTDVVVVNGFRVKSYYFDCEAVICKKVVNIQSPVDVEYFDVKSCNKLMKNKMVITSIGNVNPLKGYEDFISVASELCKVYKNIEFNIAGKLNDSQACYIEQLKDEINHSNANVNLLGMVEDTRALLCETDIYVCSSISEASPVAVWEALSMGKIVVSTDVGDVGIIIHDGVDGFVVGVGNIDMMVDRILLILSDIDAFRFMGENATKKAEKLLSTKIIVNQHVEMYNSLY
jgi:glycosyltransferase involved in cell wall biosynthesis